MDSLVIASVAFLCAFGGAMAGLLLRPRLPVEHLSDEAKEVIKLSSGVVASIAAVVLGLLVASAKGVFDSHAADMQAIATNLVILDQTLDHYGPEAKPIREALRKEVGQMVADRPASDQGPALYALAAGQDGGKLFRLLRELEPRTDSQRALHSQALQISTDVTRARLLLIARDEGSIPTPYLAVLIAWLAVVFVSFGMIAPSNATVIAVLLICALSAAGSILLIVDLDQPFSGLIQLSLDPLKNALAQFPSLN
jgi:hypothetical protein